MGKTQKEKPQEGWKFCSATRQQMVETNQRLNRRCQELEKENAIIKNSLAAAMFEFKMQANRAHYWANRLRDLVRGIREGRTGSTWWERWKFNRKMRQLRRAARLAEKALPGANIDAPA